MNRDLLDLDALGVATLSDVDLQDTDGGWLPFLIGFVGAAVIDYFI